MAISLEQRFVEKFDYYYVETRGANGVNWYKFTEGYLVGEAAALESLAQVQGFINEHRVDGEARLHLMTETEIKQLLIRSHRYELDQYLMSLSVETLQDVIGIEVDQ